MRRQRAANVQKSIVSNYTANALLEAELAARSVYAVVVATTLTTELAFTVPSKWLITVILVISRVFRRTFQGGNALARNPLVGRTIVSVSGLECLVGMNVSAWIAVTEDRTLMVRIWEPLGWKSNVTKSSPWPDINSTIYSPILTYCLQQNLNTYFYLLH